MIPRTHSAAAVRVLALIMVTFCLVGLFVWWHSKPRPFEEAEAPAPMVIDYGKSFDWRDAITPLYRAAALPADEAVKLLLQNTVDLRTNVAIALLTERRSGESNTEPIYHAKLGDPALEAAITQKIDDLVRQRLQSHGDMTSVDCWLRQPFPYSAIIALKSHTEPYASLVFEMSEGSALTENGIAMKYGPPQNRAIDEGSFSVTTYQVETKSYVAKAAFQAEPNNSQIRRISISLKRLRR
jgi:hypothetical protein